MGEVEEMEFKYSAFAILLPYFSIRLFLIRYSAFIFSDVWACPNPAEKKKTDPNPPVWTGLNEKIDI